MLASPEYVVGNIEYKCETGARPSTFRVAAAAIARNHKYAGFDVPVRHGVVQDGDYNLQWA